MQFSHTAIPAFLVLSAFVGACDPSVSFGNSDGGGPTNGAPVALYPVQTGFLAGESVRYHNLGTSSFTRGGPPQAQLALTGTATGSAPVHPMYFFFDEDGAPLLAPLWKQEATGQFFIRPRDAKHDFHKPIIDLATADIAPESYSGLWQVVKVIVPKGHKPNAITTAADLYAASKRNRANVKIVPTAFAINCPLVAPRAHVVPNVTAYEGDSVRIPQPQMELWYRGNSVECFLANGWETLGRAVWDDTGTSHLYQLLSFHEDEARVQTFDVQQVAGTGDKPIRLVAPVGLLFVPHTRVLGQDIFFEDVAVFAGPPPRRRREDPLGYRPIRWIWNLEVKASEDEPLNATTFRWSGLTDASRLEPNKLSPRQPISVINAPLSGGEVTCEGDQEGADPCASLGLVCDRRQGGHRAVCALPKVRYGAPCGPSLGQCRKTVEPTDKIEPWFVQGRRTPEAIEMVPPEAIAARSNAPIVSVDQHEIYRCVAQANEVGRCLLSCDPNQRNFLRGQTITMFRDEKHDALLEFALDSRCGGALMPGFACEPQIKVCVRSCTVEVPDSNVCALPTPMWLSEDLMDVDLAKNTTCRKSGEVSACFHVSPSPDF